MAVLFLAAPNAALANPGGLCGAQTTDGDPNTADTITCDPEEAYPDGISYNSDGGDLAVNEQVVLSGKNAVLLDVEDDGLNVTGTGDDNLEFFADLTVNSEGDPRRAGVTGSDGAVLDYLSESGDIDITVGSVVATGSATHAIRAESTTGGDISIAYGPRSSRTEGLESPGTGIFAQTTGAGTLDISADRITADGTGIEAITENGALSVTTNSGVTGGIAGIDAASAGGDIDVETRGRVSASGAAIRAESTGGGDVSIFHNPLFSTDTIGSANAAGIEAVSNGGDVTVIGGLPGSTDAAIEGFERGIFADTRGGAGEMLLDIGAEVFADANAGIAAVDAVSGTGPMTINVQDGAVIDGGAGHAIRTDAGGNAVINVDAGSALEFGEGAYAVDMTAAAGTTTTLNLGAGLGERPKGVGFGDGDPPGTNAVPLLRGAGPGHFVINNDGSDGSGGLFGGVDFRDNSGGVTFNNLADGGGWSFEGDANRFGAGDDTVNNAGLLMPASFEFQADIGERPGISRELVESAVDFGGGHNVFDNTGIVVVGDARFTFDVLSGSGGDPNPQTRSRSGKVASEARFENLDEFDNSGLIVLGGWVYEGGDAEFGGNYAPPPRNRFYIGAEGSPSRAASDVICEAVNGFPCSVQSTFDGGGTDRRINDVLAMPGTTFTGSGDSAILLDAGLSLGQAQSGCGAPRAGEAERFRLPGADCVDLSGGATAGSTRIIVRDRFQDDIGANNPEGMVIVDVSGGESAPGHFTLDPDSDSYDPETEAINKDLFLYALTYDESSRQHKLASLPSPAAMRMPLLVQAAQEIVRAGGAHGAERRGELRAAVRAGRNVTGGAWGRTGHRASRRDARQRVTAFNVQRSFVNDFDQDTATVTLGTDFVLPVGGPGTWLAGGTLGYARSEVEFEQSPSTGTFDGVNFGAYGGYVADDYFVDLAVNASLLKMDHKVPQLDLFPEGTVLSSDALMLDARVDSGWRLRVTDALAVEPLASLSWVRADFDEMRAHSDDAVGRPDNTVFGGNSPTSLRAGLGGRLSFEHALQVVRMNYALTARAWEELDGETDVLIQSAGPDATVSDEFNGAFTEVRAGIGISNLSGSVSGYLNADGTFHEDYDSLGAEVGFRYQW